MSNGSTQQMTIGDAVAAVWKSGPNLAAFAALVALAGMIAPFVSIGVDVGRGLFGQSHPMLSRSGGMSAFTAAGWTAWLTLVLFVAAAASWRVPAISAYRRLIAFAAAAFTIVTPVWAIFFSPIADQLREATAWAGGSQNFISIDPHVGMAVLIAGGGLLLLALKRPG